ncbi:putative E3 ubiquitin-protein ligase RF4 [Sesamum indicum]|uniref:E3 ubiquitin-protein ligase RF4 n=1 Tax=Sesamum indicum TaxID=4182 RepID=A0A6I9TN71_SESIN|nr:putative E3 ubiquitin-protein ligase RF4 [Sesamum indicum]XP_011082532.1 putative E3 ubiquitin-protein ligase RF4 [Sesamum indicum]XP_020550376.1 putative E3 ubiquitin-protein ligase RF4 [Sesamum indicum]
MADSGSSADGSSEGLSSVLVNEKGSRNKRKYLSDLSVDIPEVSSMSLTEFPRYEMLEEKYRNALNELGSMMERSDDTLEEHEVEEYLKADWDDPICCQLEELLTNNLFTTFCSAVKKIVESGYTEEVAEWAVLNSSLFHGSKDAVSNVVDSALALLKKEKELNTPKHPVFEGLQCLVDYTLLEMIHVLREVRPTLTVAEAMWCLLITDLNLVNACVVEGGPLGGSSGQEAQRGSPRLSQSKSETSSTSQADTNKLDNPKQTMPRAQSSQHEFPVSGPAPQPLSSRAAPDELASTGKEISLALQEAKGKLSVIGREHIQTSTQAMVTDEKSGGSRKGPSTNSKRDMLRQKTFHFEKNYKGRMSKGAFKAKVAAWGSMVLDKSLKSQSGSSGVVMKGTKLTTSAGTNRSLVEGSQPPSSNLQSAVPSGVLSDPEFPLPGFNSQSPESSVPDTAPCAKGEITVSDPPKITDYYALIPFDETLQKHMPQDDKEETILMLVPLKQALEKELQGWTDWANEKVMQAARRLGKDQGELKMLRQEKEETEKFKKEKQSLEESTMKRLSEMEYALSNATGQIEVANCTVRRLEEENSLLKKEMEDAKLQALKSATNLQEALMREQEALKKLQSWDAEKGLVLEQLTDLKSQIAELENILEKAKGRQNQFKVLLKHEEKEKLKVVNQIDTVRRKIAEEDALLKVEADRVKQTAEMSMQKCEEDIKNLENMISELRLESDKSKIAALNVGYGSCLAGENISAFPGMHLPKITKRLAVFQDNFGGDDVKPERECVMCMTDEIAVVFLPCAHQVLCGQCSVLHEKQGMNDCPSCRTTIKKRVSVTYRAD